MEEAKRKRRAARGWVTRQVNKVNDVLSRSEVKIEDLEQELQELDIRRSNLETCQQNVEMFLDDEELEHDINEAGLFLDSVRSVDRTARRHVSMTLSGTHPVRENSPRQNNANDTFVHLPKIQIAKFRGQFEEWPEFWNKFSAIIDQSDLPSISKFSHLQSLLDGEAADTVKGLSLTEDNYAVAKTLLNERYGRKERIIFAHIQRLLNIEVSKIKATNKLWQLYNELQINIRGLDNCGISGETYGVVLTPIIISRLPDELRMEWAKVSDGKEGDLEWLLSFLKDEITRRERSETYHNSSSSRTSLEGKRTPSAAVLQNKQSSTETLSCCFCGKRHSSEKCWNLKKMSSEEVKGVVRDKRLCFCCFRGNHLAKDCFRKCELCSGKHNKKFCSKPTYENQNETVSKVPYEPREATNKTYLGQSQNQRNNCSNYHHSKLTNKVSVMQVVSADINNEKCTVLFDTGSDKSYITTSCVKRLKPKYVGNENVAYACFGEKRPRNPNKRNLYEIAYAKDDNKKSFVATEIHTITAPMFREKIPVCVLEEFKSLGLSSLPQTYAKDEKISVDILIGLDAYWNLMNGRTITSSLGLVAQESVFGWLLCGSYSLQGNGSSRSVTHHQNLCMTELSDSLVRSFWELEHLGIQPKETERGPDEIIEMFRKTVQFDGVSGRYEVGLPWKEEKKVMLENNIEQAKLRLEKLERKLDNDPNLRQRYNAVLDDLEKEGIVKEVKKVKVGENKYPVFYLPHRPVVKESSSTTKVRPVFDASAAGPNKVSLNSCMNTGPNLTNNLLDVLLRFRRWKYALSGDITKAFFQIMVNEIDQDVHRFLLKGDSSFREMRITRVPFGNTCSPFLLNATIKYHLDSQPPSRAVTELYENLYVDDLLTGADSIEELKDLKSESQEVMGRAAMPLTKWCSNSAKIADQEIQTIKEKDEVSGQKVLGIRWDPVDDSFLFFDLGINCSNLMITRRVVLSVISRVFDPFGFLQPFVMVGKIVFQALWKNGLKWDDPIPEELEKTFTHWVDQLKGLDQFQVPRCYVRCSWEKKRDLEIHAFSDASEKAYGACIYLKIKEENDSVVVSLVIAKAKLCPVKKVSIPRLELLAALLSARLLNHVKKALRLPEATKYKCWTDSKVTLQWIQGDANRWKIFVANRVTEIQSLTSPEFWGHCPGSENPADLLSRGVMLDRLLTSSSWLQGPVWLCDNFELCEDCTSEGDVDFPVEEMHAERNCAQLNISAVSEPLFPVERWGEFSKAIRVVAWVLRFVKSCRQKREERCLSRELSVEEIVKGKNVLLKSTQYFYFLKEFDSLQKGQQIAMSSRLFKLKPFMGEDGLLRLEGRLQFSLLSDESKHPIVLPRCHLAELIARREHLDLKHAGVPQMISGIRNQYWIIGVRKLARKVKNQCPRCVRFDSLPCQQPIAPLPKERCQKSDPFSVTGVDHAGPLYSADNPGKKHYICLFTCAVTRAIHLELVDDLSLAQFLLAFKRFVSRRRLPLTIVSDQAQTFKAAAKRFTEMYSDKSPMWKFNTPRCPWAGGMWERCVRTVKSCLKKCLGLKCLTRLELSTLLCEIEQCINSRPLTYVGDTIDSSMILTPNHFLNGGAVGEKTTVVIDRGISEAERVRTRAQDRNEELDKFWDVWSNEYIRQLPHAPMYKPRGRLQVGSVVMVKEENIPKLKWPLGLVTKTNMSKDNVVRSVEIKTQKGRIVRPIQNIHVLELNNENEPIKDHNDPVDCRDRTNETIKLGNSDMGMVTRSGRTVKPRVPLNV